MVEALVLGLSIGLGAGVSPGPLLTLTISAALERGFAAGLRVACAPLLTDLPVIVTALWLLSTVPAGLVAALTLIGGVFVTWLGVDTVRRARQHNLATADDVPAAADLWRGALVNIASPHPWIAWMTVLGPTTVRLWERRPATSIAFVAVFYVGLVGSKIAIAAVVAWGRKRLDQRWYRVVLQICGAILIVLGVLLLIVGLREAIAIATSG